MTTTKAKYTKRVEACKSMPVQFGPMKAQVFGGPYRDYAPGQRRVVGVKMAAEIDHEHDISIPTEDFSVPDLYDMHRGLAKALEAIAAGNDLYAGCMGGVGRTGLFMSCLAKVMFNFEAAVSLPGVGAPYDEADPSTYDPVSYVRKHYNSHAVETEEQRRYVVHFDTSQHVQWLIDNLGRKVEYVTVDKPVYVFNPFKAWLQLWGFGNR
jgi:hypothetical protein